MTPDGLLEKVHEAVLDTDNYYVSIDQIRMAIRVTLEEAAKVCDDPCPECAAAIRAMIPKNTP